MSVDFMVMRQAGERWESPFPKEWLEPHIGEYPGTATWTYETHSAWRAEHADKMDAWYADPANRNPAYRPELTGINMANGNAADFIEQVLHMVEEQDGPAPVEVVEAACEAWLAEYPWNGEHQAYCRSWFGPEGAGHATVDETTHYLSMRAFGMLEYVRIGREHGATHLAWS